MSASRTLQGESNTMLESDDDYILILRQEKHMYQWCLENIGRESREDASRKAEEFYHYQSADEKYRTLVFHDEAWHWAMLHLKGEEYWSKFPEFAEPSVEYELELKRYIRARI